MKDLLDTYRISDDEIAAIKKFGGIVIPRIPEYIESIYEWMKTIPDYNIFFSDEKKLADVKQKQSVYWEEFFLADLTEDYLQERRAVGQAHARIGLSLPTYFAAMSRSKDIFIVDLYDGSLKEKEYIETVFAVAKLFHLDIAVVVETYSNFMTNKLKRQQEAILEMSTPVMTLGDDIVLFPVVGLVDSYRAQMIMQTVLGKVSEVEANVAIIDIMGVTSVDSAVAAHLLKVSRACKLLGCECILSGLSPRVAETLVYLGVEMGDIVTTSTVKNALTMAFEMHKTTNRIVAQ